MRSQGRGERQRVPDATVQDGDCVDDCWLHFLKHTGISLEAGSNHLVFSTLTPNPLRFLFYFQSLIWLAVISGRSDLISPNAVAAAAKTLSVGNFCSPSEILSFPTTDNLCINLTLDHGGEYFWNGSGSFTYYPGFCRRTTRMVRFAVVNNSIQALCRIYKLL